jgi:DNA-binding YbaB/EbfC family protein
MKGFPGNLQQMMKQAQKMRQDIEKVSAQAESQQVEGSAGGGAVKVVANGKGLLLSVQIQKDAVNPQEVEMLQDLVLAAANDAISKAQSSSKSEMEKITGGLSIPGLF